MAKTITPNEVIKMKELYGQGYSLAQIGKELGLSRNTLKKYLVISNNVIRRDTKSMFIEKKENNSITISLNIETLYNLDQLKQNIGTDTIEETARLILDDYFETLSKKNSTQEMFNTMLEYALFNKLMKN
ncbi:MAG: helix-turn-helix domain-containing protein [Candidatus Nanoarchaeia archaeon]